jgi:hypothetical protein
VVVVSGLFTSPLAHPAQGVERPWWATRCPVFAASTRCNGRYGAPLESRFATHSNGMDAPTRNGCRCGTGQQECAHDLGSARA